MRGPAASGGGTPPDGLVEYPPPSATPETLLGTARRWFLLFLLLVLGLGVVLVLTGERDPLRATVTVGAVAALAALSVYRLRRLTNSIVCDVGAAGLVFFIGWGMSDNPEHGFVVVCVHLFLRALDPVAWRVAVNAVLNPLALIAATAVASAGIGPGMRVRMVTNLVGLLFAAGLMHALAKRVVEYEHAKAEVTHRAFHDPLTGLPNRALLTDRLEQALDRSRRRGSRVALAFIDIDDLKRLNDQYGHRSGDEMLTDFARRLRENIRVTDTAARFGGDEFAVVMEDVQTSEEARVATDRLRAGLRHPFTIGELSHDVSASVGVVLSDESSTAAEMLDRADSAMYVAKAGGKDRLEIYDGAAHGPIRPRTGFETPAITRPL
jgi:diguanylate cyclase (GGDEF)-like protein